MLRAAGCASVLYLEAKFDGGGLTEYRRRDNPVRAVTVAMDHRNRATRLSEIDTHSISEACSQPASTAGDRCDQVAHFAGA
jgi:hypothetical protein